MKFIKEKFHQIKDRILLYNNFSDISSSCYICDTNHFSLNCPKVFTSFSKESILKKWNFTKDQERVCNKKGRKLMKWNTLKNISLLNDIGSFSFFELINSKSDSASEDEEEEECEKIEEENKEIEKSIDSFNSIQSIKKQTFKSRNTRRIKSIKLII